MLIAELQEKLVQSGLPRVPAAIIRYAEDRGHIPPAARTWRGFREFNDEHIKALAKYLARRQNVA